MTFDVIGATGVISAGLPARDYETLMLQSKLLLLKF